VAVLALALVAAACGGDDEDETTSGAQESSSSTSAPESGSSSTSAAEPEGGDAALELADSPLGQILVDAEGFTLYLFTNDEGGQSACTGGCAETWPPVEAPDDPAVGEGLDESLVGAIERDDGSMQLTYGDAPLYRYSPDGSPGDTTGQGVGGVWFVVGADGEAITSDAEEQASDSYSY